MPEEPLEPETEVQFSSLKELVDAANGGDAEALEELQDLLDAQPRIWQTVGNFGMLVEQKLVAIISRGNQLLAESLSRQLAAMRQKLTRANCSPLERLAVERVVATHLQLLNSETNLAVAPPGSFAGKFWLRRQDLAERAFAGAMRSLRDHQRFVPVQAQAAATSESPQPVRATGT